jgi:hypothetical protein
MVVRTYHKTVGVLQVTAAISQETVGVFFLEMLRTQGNSTTI